jgi:hypothetical protein
MHWTKTTFLAVLQAAIKTGLADVQPAPADLPKPPNPMGQAVAGVLLKDGSVVVSGGRPMMQVYWIGTKV